MQASRPRSSRPRAPEQAHGAARSGVGQTESPPALPAIRKQGCDHMRAAGVQKGRLGRVCRGPRRATGRGSQRDRGFARTGRGGGGEEGGFRAGFIGPGQGPGRIARHCGRQRAGGPTRALCTTRQAASARPAPSCAPAPARPGGGRPPGATAETTAVCNAIPTELPALTAIVAVVEPAARRFASARSSSST